MGVHPAEKVYGAVPPLAVAVNVSPPEPVWHVEGPVIDTLGFGLTVKLPEPEPVQRFASVTVTG